jgi:hypothetical protein
MLSRRSLAISVLVFIVAVITAWAVFSRLVHHGAITSLAEKCQISGPSHIELL